MALIMVFTFLAMILFGGIAVDVMRFETRRVALQQTLDRAALAAASLTQTRTPQQIAGEWFAKSGLSTEDLAMVDFTDPTVTTFADAGQRRITMTARVRSNNFFMGIYSDNDYLEGPARTSAAQGVSQIEVMLVLDITGSMTERLADGRRKIDGLREAAGEFVRIVKENDRRDGVSIGVVPYHAQVNVPEAVRRQFTTLNRATWNGVPDAGVPNINCLEIPENTFDQTALSQTLPIRMAAVADMNSATATTTDFRQPNGFRPQTGPIQRPCTTLASAPTANQLLLPTKDPVPVRARIAGLVADGNTNIATGMRWATALLDQAARPIYTAVGDATVQGRPANNDSLETRKIIVLMTDGEHFTNSHILDNYKSGPSPIWRGTDGRYAMRFWPGGFDLNDNARPVNCSGWTIPATDNREYFVPHLKRNTVAQRVNVTEPEGQGTGAAIAGACDPRAWVTAPTWPLLNSSGNPVLDSSGSPVMVTATRLDWSEVWQDVRVSYVARQFYMRSNVDGTGNYDTIMNLMRRTYLGSNSNMDRLLQLNCTAARAAGIEVYGIAFAAPARGRGQINGCASEPKGTYYYDAANNAALLAAFREIAVDISDLRLTQ